MSLLGAPIKITIERSYIVYKNSFLIIWLFDNSHGYWRHHIKNVGLLISLFTWVQNKERVQNLVNQWYIYLI